MIQITNFPSFSTDKLLEQAFICRSSSDNWVYLPLVLLALPMGTQAQGPGLGNLTYTANELWRPISVLHSPQEHGNTAMVNGFDGDLLKRWGRDCERWRDRILACL